MGRKRKSETRISHRGRKRGNICHNLKNGGKEKKGKKRFERRQEVTNGHIKHEINARWSGREARGKEEGLAGYVLHYSSLLRCFNTFNSNKEWKRERERKKDPGLVYCLRARKSRLSLEATAVKYVYLSSSVSGSTVNWSIYIYIHTYTC